MAVDSDCSGLVRIDRCKANVGISFAFHLWFRDVSGETEPKLGYTHRQHAGNIHTLRSFTILPETLPHPPSLPQSSRENVDQPIYHDLETRSIEGERHLADRQMREYAPWKWV